MGIGGACALLGSLVIGGWCLHMTALVQIRPNLAPMKSNTALACSLGGIALAGWTFGMARRDV